MHYSINKNFELNIEYLIIKLIIFNEMKAYIN